MGTEPRRNAKGQWPAGSSGTPESCRHGVHGLDAMKRTLSLIRKNGGKLEAELGEVGLVVREWKEALIADLGGEESVTTQQRVIVEMAARSWVLLESIDLRLLEMAAEGRLMSKGGKLIGAVAGRQKIANGLANYMVRLGLERKARPAVSLAAYLSQKATTASEALSASDGQNTIPGSQGLVVKGNAAATLNNAASVDSGACPECGGEVPPNKPGGSVRRFCSPSCRNKSWRRANRGKR